jgi:hypothetical protein
MKRLIPQKNTFIKLIPLILVAVFVVACSENANPLVSSSEIKTDTKASIPGMDESLFQNPYPAITPEMLADGPAPGYRYITSRATALDDGDTLVGYRWCERNANREVRINNLVKVVIPALRLQASSWVAVVAPLGYATVADFYPHPYQFSGNVEIVWDIEEFDLPEDFDYDSLVPLYLADDGTITEMPHYWNDGHDELIVITDHFSRYIVAQRLD